MHDPRSLACLAHQLYHEIVRLTLMLFSALFPQSRGFLMMSYELVVWLYSHLNSDSHFRVCLLRSSTFSAPVPLAGKDSMRLISVFKYTSSTAALNNENTLELIHVTKWQAPKIKRKEPTCSRNLRKFESHSRCHTTSAACFCL